MTHSHAFNDGNPLAERRTAWATTLTAVMMVIEITGGWLSNSMALLADGWHMSSHTLALGLALFAYMMARRFAHDRRFAFGTWKMEVLGGYTSAILLLLVAATMAWESIARLLAPTAIHYDEAIAIAIVGLAVNLGCAALLHGGHAHHHHGHDHGRGGHHHHDRHDHHDHAHADLNLRAAYLHVVADAATSVLAIVALLGGRWFGAAWLDPMMGIVGAVLVAVWAAGLLRSTSKVLLDAEMDAPVVDEIREVLAASQPPVALQDLHVWRVAQHKYACIVGVESGDSRAPDDYRQALSVHEELVHITVEINRPPAA
ncbi:CDF family Co(II)/Ni(II) efflux transporter DmeF [Solimonas marina]|uniref:CDF family Co(II)/Ni(II) efflux transporter DmeF n=1 Tax=Solimonas marina TaxID=2714601 RepID=A0A970B789_9GAMM|nr:CDF family Co(II)/Ni(II) efflux transporter DmeF [Solimonas marina]NKF20964.1 CDF family Co(II)/Ni(II) efflux transporter DmeF [Solimonas marina]